MTHSNCQLSETICPHWSLKNRNCLVSHEGLYLPVTEHVAIYCEGGNFSSCPQYLSLEMGTNPELTTNMDENRRHHRRVNGRYQVLLTRYGDGVTGQTGDDSATTVDISPGGIRLESHDALPEGSRVFFSLNGEFSTPPVEGTGVVKWCHSLANRPLYHSGISFIETSVVRAIRERLGQATA